MRVTGVPPSRTRRTEAAGLDALIRGFQLSVPDDHEKLLLTRAGGGHRELEALEGCSQRQVRRRVQNEGRAAIIPRHYTCDKC